MTGIRWCDVPHTLPPWYGRQGPTRDLMAHGSDSPNDILPTHHWVFDTSGAPSLDIHAQSRYLEANPSTNGREKGEKQNQPTGSQAKHRGHHQGPNKHKRHHSHVFYNTIGDVGVSSHCNANSLARMAESLNRHFHSKTDHHQNTGGKGGIKNNTYGTIIDIPTSYSRVVASLFHRFSSFLTPFWAYHSTHQPIPNSTHTHAAYACKKHWETCF